MRVSPGQHRSLDARVAASKLKVQSTLNTIYYTTIRAAKYENDPETREKISEALKGFNALGTCNQKGLLSVTSDSLQPLPDGKKLFGNLVSTCNLLQMLKVKPDSREVSTTIKKCETGEPKVVPGNLRKRRDTLFSIHVDEFLALCHEHDVEVTNESVLDYLASKQDTQPGDVVSKTDINETKPSQREM